MVSLHFSTWSSFICRTVAIDKKKKKKGRDSRVGKYRRRHTHDDRRIIEFLVVSIAVRNVHRGVQSYFFGMPAGCEVCRGIRHRTGTRLCGLATNDDYAPWCGNFAGNPEGLPTVEKKKWEESAKVARGRHKCPNYLGAGIRSTVIIWTGQRNLGGRRNLRDGRGPPPPLRPSAATAGCPNSHSNTPNRPVHPLSPPARCNANPTLPPFHRTINERTVRVKILRYDPDSLSG